MHKFPLNCVDGAVLLVKPTVRAFVKALFEQSKTLHAKELWDLPAYMEKFQDVDTDLAGELGQYSPAYFGAGGDWFLTEFLNHFGTHFNLHNVVSLLDTEVNEKDVGIDGHAQSRTPGSCKLKMKTWKAGSPVELQYKTSINPTKELFLNESRLGNFGAAVATRALLRRQMYSTRAIIVTTAKGVYHTVTECLGESTEVISYRRISDLADNDLPFWNALRTRFNLPPLAFPVVKENDEEEVTV